MSGFLSRGFKPFFLGSALFAALAIPLWSISLAGWFSVLDDAVTPDWHTHEMIFGYTGGVVAGFALTAVPNWTGRLPVSGVRLALLFGVWLLGRIAMLATPVIGSVGAAIAEAAFLPLLAGYLLREILAAGNLRNIPIAGLVAAIALANLFWHGSHFAGWDSSIAERCGLALFAMLITLVGGRITPSFTHNWLKKAGQEASVPGVTVLDKAALVITAAALAAWTAAPEQQITGVLLMISGAMLVLRMCRWRGLQTVSEPLVLILHIGYLWLAISFVLLGAAALMPDMIAQQMAVHALTAGAIGTMTLAVMTRASLGHTGASLRADRLTIAIFVLVTCGAVVRTLASSESEYYLSQVVAGGVLWCGAFALFAVSYGPRLMLEKRKDPPVKQGGTGQPE